MKMQYAIFLTFTAIVKCQVDEVISPDTQPTAVENIDDLTKSIKDDAPFDYYNQDSHEIESLAPTEINTNMTINEESLPPLRRRAGTDVKSFVPNKPDSLDMGEHERTSINPWTGIKTTETKNTEPQPSLSERVSKYVKSFVFDNPESHKIEDLGGSVVKHARTEITTTELIDVEHLKTLNESTSEHAVTLRLRAMKDDYENYGIGGFKKTSVKQAPIEKAISELTYIENLKMLNESAGKNMSFGIDDYDIHEFGGLEETSVKYAPYAKTTSELTKSLIERPSKNILAFGLEHYDTHEIEDFEASKTKTASTSTIESVISEESLPSLNDFISRDILIPKLPENLKTDVKPKGTNTNERYSFKETAVVDFLDVRFDDIRNDDTVVVVENNTYDNGNSGLGKQGNNSNGDISESKFLKLDEAKGSTIVNKSDIVELNLRKVFLTNPLKKKGTDIHSIQGDIYKKVFGDSVEYRPVDFSKSTYLGVPMNMLLTFLRSKNSADGRNKNQKGVPFLETPTDLAHGVVDFVKGSARQIGDLVMRGR